jgi:hypothetical protein
MSNKDRVRPAGAKEKAEKTPLPGAASVPPPLPPQVAPPVVPPGALVMPPEAVASPPRGPVVPPAAPLFPPAMTAAQPSASALPVPIRVNAAPHLATPVKAPGPAVTPVVPAVKKAKPPLSVGIQPAVELGSEEDVDLTGEAMKHSPPFLVSMLVHMILVIGLALFTIHEVAESQVEINASYVDSQGLQMLEDKLQSPEALDVPLETPAFSLGAILVDDPLAAPPKFLDPTRDATQGITNVEAPNIGMALTGREAGMKKAWSQIYGANATTEGAVVAGLEWLKKQQMRDGGWSLVGPYPDGAVIENRCAATAMALLAFQGYGSTHKSSALKPDFHDVVERGWNYLLKTQDKDGMFQHEGGHNHRLYAQAQATIAICEIYGMTKDQKFKRPAQLALDYAHKAQSPELGGWRYQPRLDSDTSVTGWFVMAFQSGLMAGLEVQSPNLDMVNRFLDKVAHDGGAQYGYQIGTEPLLSMTAEALLCRQYLGWKHDDERLRRGIDILLKNRIEYSEDPNIYYWYYATQACHHMDGDDWNRWNEAMRREVPAAQIKSGPNSGSWPVPLSDRWAPHGGRLFVTSLSVFMLETYYRHLPIYKWRLQ